MLRMKEVTGLKDAAENLNTRKSTINWVRVFENWCDENGLEKNPETVRPRLGKLLEFRRNARKIISQFHSSPFDYIY